MDTEQEHTVEELETLQKQYDNFLDLYLYHTGVSEVPRQYHYWCALSVLAALVGDRVWLRVSVGKTVYPNLYVFLIGPSGGGKGASIDIAMKLLSGIDSTNLYAGSTTKQAFIDFMVRGAKIDADGMRTAERPCTYFVTEELASSLPQGELAYGLLTFMTAIFMRPTQPIIEGTRGRGCNRIVQPTCNWLAGSNEVWLVEAIPKSAMESGFLARVCLVQAKRDKNKRHPRAIYPEDYQAAYAALRYWAESYTMLHGEFTMTEEALQTHDHWYMTRPYPEDRAMEPSFFRSDEMVYKLALLMAIADWTGGFFEGGVPDCDMKVQARHMEEAIEAWTYLTFDIGGVVDMASTTPQSSDVLKVKEILERTGQLDRSQLMRKAGGRGLNQDRLDRALATLFASEEVRVTQGEGGKRWYTWNG